jgi:hypothetical protein
MLGPLGWGGCERASAARITGPPIASVSAATSHARGSRKEHVKEEKKRFRKGEKKMGSGTAASTYKEAVVKPSRHGKAMRVRN